MLSRNHSNDRNANILQWEDLNFGAPTIIAFASLCSRAMTIEPGERHAVSVDELSEEAKTILAAAANRGIIDVRASREPFDSAERFLAVCVEFEIDRRKLFLDKRNPDQTIKFLEGFRQLCQAGLIIHHLQKDFSLSASGFELAKSLNQDDYQALLEFSQELDH